MEASPLKIKTAVPVEVQKVLDAMTEENWAQFGCTDESKCGDKMCFIGRATEVHEQWWRMLEAQDLNDRVAKAYGTEGVNDDIDAVAVLNDKASSLADFKSKIIALYETEG